MKNNLCIIQARMGATRLPGKVLMKVNGQPLLEYEINRIKQTKNIDKIVVATTVTRQDDAIEKFCQKIGIDCFRGSESDVLDRFYQCSLNYPEYRYIVRITGDCPLIDPQVIDQVVDFFENNSYDYASNVEIETFPDGMDVEIFKKEALLNAWQNAKKQSEREHVTLYIRNKDRFKVGNLAAEKNYGHIRLTVDQKEDIDVIDFLFRNSDLGASYLDYISLLKDNPDVSAKNQSITRNEGLIKSLKNDSETK